MHIQIRNHYAVKEKKNKKNRFWENALLFWVNLNGFYYYYYLLLLVVECQFFLFIYFFFWRFSSKLIHQSHLFALIFAVVHNHIEKLISLNRINRFFLIFFCPNSMTIFLSHFSFADSLFRTRKIIISFCLHFVHLVSHNK